MIRNCGLVIKDSLRTAHSHPQIFLYPYIALIFISSTYSFISSTLLAHWYSRIFDAADYVAPHKVAAIFGVVGFSVFYTFLVTAYFTTATSASVLAMLDNRPSASLYGLKLVWHNLGRVTKFALLAVFFFPIGIIAQRRKLPTGWFGVLGSSLTLHMPQVAPAILSTKKDFEDTLNDSIDTMGKAWHEGLVIKIGMYLTIFIVIVVPKLIQHQWFKSQTASNIGWLVSIELAASGYVVFKVIGSIFTTVLYHKAKTKQIE